MANLIWNSILLGIPDTQPHTIVSPHAIRARQGIKEIVFLGLSYTKFFNFLDIIVINENGDINEDGTVLNDTDDAIENENMDSTANHGK